MRIVEAESFFNFFKSKKLPDNNDDDIASEEADKILDELDTDLRIAEEVIENLIPKSLYYYMGLIEESSSDPDESDYESDYEEDEEESSDNDEKRKHKHNFDNNEKTEPKKPCNQQ